MGEDPLFWKKILFMSLMLTLLLYPLTFSMSMQLYFSFLLSAEQSFSFACISCYFKPSVFSIFAMNFLCNEYFLLSFFLSKNWGVLNSKYSISEGKYNSFSIAKSLQRTLCLKAFPCHIYNFLHLTTLVLRCSSEFFLQSKWVINLWLIFFWFNFFIIYCFLFFTFFYLLTTIVP